MDRVIYTIPVRDEQEIIEQPFMDRGILLFVIGFCCLLAYALVAEAGPRALITFTVYWLLYYRVFADRK